MLAESIGSEKTTRIEEVEDTSFAWSLGTVASIEGGVVSGPPSVSKAQVKLDERECRRGL
ncbi:MAG: hypothetical protein MPW14_17210 [Candidatus Manganitrophus sp.]|nr:MAG: hypothetical protein MPW14_17210 [Candidatus Manganitrophus sp.]